LGHFALAVGWLWAAGLAHAAMTAPSAPAMNPADLSPSAAAAAAAAAGAGTAGDVPAFSGRIDPDSYRVGPGDEFAFRSSDLLDSKIVRVGPTGELLLPDTGPIHVAGLTLVETEARVRETLRPFIRGKGFVLLLHRPRRFRAVVVGDVERPGTVLVQAPVHASDVIAAAGGVTWRGARRGIFVRRGPDTLWVDLARFERTGSADANPLVFETDVVVVPPRARTVDVQGAVGHPETYDVAPHDRVSTLLAAAGGLLEDAAADRIALSRESAPGKRVDVVVATGEDPEIQAGDRLFVPSRSHWREIADVEVRGEVKYPGPYAIADGEERLGPFLERAGGLTDWADGSAIRIEREASAAVRDTAFFRLAREQEGLIPASEQDYLVTLARENRAVSLSAASWIRKGSDWRDIVLLDGDRVLVPRRSLTVMVQGEVKAPGHVPFEAGRSVSDYIGAAGGATGRANRARIRVTLAATGRAVGAGDVAALQAGDAIWVPAREPRSSWGVLRDVLTTAAQAATIYLVVREATR
jgi:protein involved in polysaccharide export with SLBB domain